MRCGVQLLFQRVECGPGVLYHRTVLCSENSGFPDPKPQRTTVSYKALPLATQAYWLPCTWYRFKIKAYKDYFYNFGEAVRSVRFYTRESRETRINLAARQRHYSLE